MGAQHKRDKPASPFGNSGNPGPVGELARQNGTFVKGDRVVGPGPRRLCAGDEMAVGDSLFVVDGDGDVAMARFGSETLVVAGGPPGDAEARAVAAAGDGPARAV